MELNGTDDLLEGLDTGFGGNFSSANFRDGDAGSAAIDSKPVNLRRAMDNLFVHLGNRIKDDQTEQNFNETRRLLIAYNSQSYNSKILPFLKEDLETITVERFNKVARVVGSDLFNPQSTETFKQIDISGYTLEDDLLYKQMKDYNAVVVAQYKGVVEEMIKCDNELNNKILAFDTISNSVDTIAKLEVNDATGPMLEGFTRYLKNYYDKNNLETSFKNFMQAYKRFLLYKDFLGVVAASEPENKTPLCAVCIEGTVNTAFVPCGHTFCATCSSRNLRVCYLCRTEIQQKVRLYFN
jgi:hypothetical protein